MLLGMLKWTPIPLVRIAAVFCAGILLGIYQFEWMAPHIAIGVFIALLAAFGVALLVQSRILKGFLAFGAVFIAGYVLVHVRTQSAWPEHFIHINDPILAYEGIVEDHLYERKNSFKTTISVKRIKTERGWRETSGKVNLYVSKKSIQDNIQWGNKMLVRGSPSAVQPPSNPHEFDFKRFLTFRNTYHQHFVQGTDVIWLGHTRKDFFLLLGRSTKTIH